MEKREKIIKEWFHQKDYFNPARKTSKLKHIFLILAWLLTKVIYPKYSKHWLSTVAHTIIDCVCSKLLNHGLNHELLFSVFKFFGWKNILN